ncbi:MAG TPA: hypothetical protein DCS89_15930 [Gammaproteobacteria bacterium]|jgi:hypothetical protein|nr:hypothetical protein [Gammaproteobacteria bacterium]HAT28507.1 hypothetical protein [Gammaproteobacteria bacterium]|tara:strand:- start:354 stop:1001 length:648 start_codon:yes stop_codon:yes gene_type:complete
MSLRHSIPLLLVFIASTCVAQENPVTSDSTGIDGLINQGQAIEDIRLGTTREVKVIAPTLAPEEIDRAVLSRLMQEIVSSPELTQRRLGVDENQLQNIFITLSNARSFINDSGMANIRAMCRAWDKSELTGNDRIREALSAYSRRQQLTRNFIEKYYRVVRSEIDSFLAEESKLLFSAYMDDRGRRMANAGATSSGAIVQNLGSGTETVQFHCHD